MSKELEAFKRIKESLLHAVGGNGEAHYRGYSDSVKPAEEDLNVVETALKREDSIEITAIDIEQDNKALCKENKKLKQALKIIKEKEVDIIAIKISTSLEQYNCKEDGRIPLTQEEYDLLKEVLL